MAQPQGQETERVESPFARRAGATRVPAVTSETASEPEVIAVDEPASPASVKVRRLSVHPPRRLDGLRPMTGYEEELVEDVAFRSNTAALCNEVLARCLCKVGESTAEAGARVGELLVAERDVAIVDLRRLTFGDRVETRVLCPECGAENRIGFDLTQVAIEAEEVAEGLEVALTDGRTALLRLPTAKDQADLLATGLQGLAERRTWLIERALKRLGDSDGPLGFDVVHALDSRTRLELERQLELAIPQLDLRVGASCEACSHEFAAPFDIASFFLPS